MIAQFSVANFRSIKQKLTLSFIASANNDYADYYISRMPDNVGLLKMAIIYGANASGKTTILEALDFFRQLMISRPADKAAPIAYDRFMFDDTSRSAPSTMSMCFYLNGHKHVLSIDFDNTKVINESLTFYETTHPSILYRRSYDAANDSSSVSFGDKLRLTPDDKRNIRGNTTKNCSLMAAFGTVNVSRATQLNHVYTFFATAISELIYPRLGLWHYTHAQLKNDNNGNLKRFLLTFLKASDFNISDFTLRDADTTRLTFTHHTTGGYYELDEAAESNGTIRYMGVATLLHRLLSTNTIVTIDEMETSIHYELLTYLLRSYLMNTDEHHSQLIFTTHDINLLNEDFLRRDVVWFTEKDGNGATLLSRLSNASLHKNISPYNAYRQGKIIALPFVASPYFNLHGNEK